MISVTMLSSYLYCARKLYLEYVLRLSEPPKESLVLGSIRHETYDMINKSEEAIVKSITKKTPFEEVYAAYKKEHSLILREAIKENAKELRGFGLAPEEVFRRTWPKVLIETERRAKNLFSFMEKNNIYGEELWEKLTPKIISELKVTSEALGLKGIVDMMEVYDDSIVPIELKTGKSPMRGAWDSHRVQLLAYIMLLSEKNGSKTIREGRIIYLDTNKTVPVMTNPFAEIEVKELIEKVSALLKSEKIPDFCGSDNKCNACGLKGSCYNEKELKNRLNASPRPNN